MNLIQEFASRCYRNNFRNILMSKFKCKKSKTCNLYDKTSKVCSSEFESRKYCGEFK